VSVDEAISFTGLSRTTIYQLISDNALESRKVLGRRLIMVPSLMRLVRGDKPDQQPSTPEAA
jgi:excisionase family DNA binding protein